MYGGMDPGEMTPDGRANEIAGILAQGFLRLRKDGPHVADSASNSVGENPVTSNISNGCAKEKSAS